MLPSTLTEKVKRLQEAELKTSIRKGRRSSADVSPDLLQRRIARDSSEAELGRPSIIARENAAGPLGRRSEMYRAAIICDTSCNPRKIP